MENKIITFEDEVRSQATEKKSPNNLGLEFGLAQSAVLFFDVFGFEEKVVGDESDDRHHDQEDRADGNEDEEVLVVFQENSADTDFGAYK